MQLKKYRSKGFWKTKQEMVLFFKKIELKKLMEEITFESPWISEEIPTPLLKEFLLSLNKKPILIETIYEQAEPTINDNWQYTVPIKIHKIQGNKIDTWMFIYGKWFTLPSNK
jgi:hypothetical protein